MSRLVFNAVLGGTTTLESTNSADTFLITVPAANGTMSVKDSSGDATFRNITLTGAVLAGAWNGSTITVPYGGTGATTLTGYVKGNGTSAMTASATIPNTDITGLGTMSTQNANAVTITGGTISGLGTPLAVASGGSGAATLTGYLIGNGTSAYTASATIPNTDITGLGTMSTQSADSVAITGGTANGLTIGASNPAAAIFTTLRFNSTLSANGSTGTAGQVLTSNGASAPTWQSVAGVGTVTSVDGSGGTTGLTLTGGPITASGTLTLGGTLGVANGGTGATTLTGYVIGNGTSAMTASATIPSSDITGLGTMSTQDANNVTITGGTVNGVAIGASSASTGAFTTLTTSANAIISDNSANAALRITQTGAGNALLVEDDTNPDSSPFVVTAAGDVGVGTASPSALLHVSNAAAKIRIGLNASSQYTDIYRDNATGFTVYNAAQAATFRGHVWQLGGSEAMRIASTGTISLGAAPGAESLRVTPVASAVNYLEVQGATTSNRLGLIAAGSDANIGLTYIAKGSGLHVFGGQSATIQFVVSSTASAVNYLQVTGGATGNAATLSAQGSDSNIELALTPKGTGYVKANAAYSPNITLSDAATISWDTSTGQVATFTFVSSNRTMGAPTNLKNGAFYALAVIQNAGSNTLTWNSVFKWAAGTAPTLSTAAGAKDYFTFRSDGTNLYQQGISQAVA